MAWYCFRGGLFAAYFTDKICSHIGAVSSQESSLIVKGSEEADGMQIDLLIDRADDAVNVCEMKFYKAPYAVTKGYAQVLNSRLQVWKKRTLPRHSSLRMWEIQNW